MRLPPANTQPCALCGRRGSNRHERLTRGRGGLRDDFNTIVLCGSGTTGCHGKVTGNPQWALAKGYIVTGYMLHGKYVGSDLAYREHYGDGRLEALTTDGRYEEMP